jgi:hypothetical protein
MYTSNCELDCQSISSTNLLEISKMKSMSLGKSNKHKQKQKEIFLIAKIIAAFDLVHIGILDQFH